MADDNQGYWNPERIGAAGLGGAALLNYFGNNKTPDFNNPASASMPFLQQIPETLRPYFQPYINKGNEVDPVLKNQFNSMTTNPGNFLSSVSQGYEQSPGYQFKLNQALKAANNAAAAGGMLGSGQHQFQNEQIAEGLANQDFETWLNRVLGIFGGGQKGLQGISDRGFDASTGYGNDLASALMSQASFAGEGAAEQNRFNQAESNAKNESTGDLFGLGAKLLESFF
ncbi:MAG TPA: hypothetical protein VHM20_05605 [Gammaproteobacteria bacterium]|jgi:hypothetical protein|nr:hypothetical protein [Gammaproteobacteria bacterium]